ncbi:membrane anchoring protein efr3a [Datura stramonium]|uniref:Membrane anchoring protein efr3a n=1 Tax=Datura stramonium TaxID=4076 RepID=A0ABS8VE80_DATST|nr:membrane anchoring protein efr3a [Datura stramonium]
MGISHRIMPACDQLCVCCPAMRTRSRQPVKRYKKLISDSFPRSPDGEPNDRMINKLCEYASKNPLRIPKITTVLEQRCYRELRNENLGSVKVVMCIYRKLLTTCKQQMPLFAGSFLSIIHILLDQMRHDEMRTVGCQALFDFIINQRDSTYMFNFEGLIPKICLLAQEMGEDERVLKMRCAGLQALSAMIWFMGEFCHMPAEFDSVTAAVLENCEGPKEKLDLDNDNQDKQNEGVQQVSSGENQMSSSSDELRRATSWKNIVTDRGLNVTAEDARNPEFWSKVCLHNMAKLAKEATTVRRVLESLFRYFDNADLWSPEHGVALVVLLDMQSIMENSGQNTHFLLSTLIKHLDHKNILKNPNMQIEIVEVASSLSKATKAQSSVTIVGAFSDMMRHLRKSILCSVDDSELGEEVIQWNRKLYAAVDECLVQMSQKVGDAGPILDVMAVMLESISNVTVMVRNTMAAVYRTAQIIASLPNHSYKNKAFPEALFHQILLAMVSPDHETRLVAHRVFSVVLVPSSVCPRNNSANQRSTKATGIQRTLSRTVSVFSSSAALFDKLKKEQASGHDNMAGKEKTFNAKSLAKNQSMLKRLTSSYSRAYTVKRNSSPVDEVKENGNTEEEQDGIFLKLKIRQISLLLSSLWVQAISPANTPENYEAIAHTYSLVVLFSQTKKSSHEALIRSFQLAFSLRNISIGGKGSLPPSRRRSLFMLATSMIIFLSKAYNFIPVVACAKAALTDKTVDPFLRLVEDCKLEAVTGKAENADKVYGSKEDDDDALKSLSAIQLSSNQTTEYFASIIVESLRNSYKNKTAAIKDQLLKDFLPDDVCPLGAQLVSETSGNIYQFGSSDDKSLDEGGDLTLPILEDGLTTENQNLSNSHLTLQIPDLLTVTQFLDSVSDTTLQGGRLSVSTSDMTFKDMAGHCEALQAGKQQKMSHLMIAQASRGNPFDFYGQDYIQANCDNLKSPVQPTHVKHASEPNLSNPFINVPPMPCAAESNFFALPASSPYDNFLKAAGS